MCTQSDKSSQIMIIKKKYVLLLLFYYVEVKKKRERKIVVDSVMWIFYGSSLVCTECANMQHTLSSGFLKSRQ